MTACQEHDDFRYVLDKIETSSLSDDPFTHLQINDLLSDEHFAEVIGSPEIDIPPVADDRALIDALYAQHFEAIKFPGTTTSISQYLKWHRHKKAVRVGGLVEGYGMTMRLKQTREGSLLQRLGRFFESTAFWQAAAGRFGVDLELVRRDSGLQKYLDGYEISPHPDVRGKALTFMLNVNPAPDSETIDYHTRYLRFTPESDHIRQRWVDNPAEERRWVSWGSCDVVSQQTRNNSIVIFSPSNDTLHAVKANYDHLRTQRTQYYGNLWYSKAAHSY